MQICSLSKESLNFYLHKSFPAHSIRVAPLIWTPTALVYTTHLELYHIGFMIIESFICIDGLLFSTV